MRTLALSVWLTVKLAQIKILTVKLASVQTSPISFVARVQQRK